MDDKMYGSINGGEIREVTADEARALEDEYRERRFQAICASPEGRRLLNDPNIYVLGVLAEIEAAMANDPILRETPSTNTSWAMFLGEPSRLR